MRTYDEIDSEIWEFKDEIDQLLFDGEKMHGQIANLQHCITEVRHERVMVLSAKRIERAILAHGVDAADEGQDSCDSDEYYHV